MFPECHWCGNYRYSRPVRYLFAALRFAAAVAIIVAVVAQWSRSLDSGVYSFWNFFGYFTIQSNLLIAVAFVIVAAFGVRGVPTPEWLLVSHAATVTYLATTGLVYNTLLRGSDVDNSFTVQWSNDILHVWIPLFAVLEWILLGDRDRLSWKRLWFFLIYPVVWLVVILIRGQSFVPYPFLNVDKLGAGVVALYCLGIAVFIAGMSALVIWLSRYRVIRDDSIVERDTLSRT
ncbi:MAG: hypothetical protein JWP75_873 [Frondihabitans sp.]|nr:hypothetical protein [Frondihabitans sp.]